MSMGGAGGRPPIILPEDKAARALNLLSLRLSFRQVAEDIGVHEKWLSRAYSSKRLHGMAAHRYDNMAVDSAPMEQGDPRGFTWKS